MGFRGFVFSNKPGIRISRHVVFWLFRAAWFYMALWGVYVSLPIENEDTQSSISAISLSFIGRLVLFDAIYTYAVAYFLMPFFFKSKRYLLFWIFCGILTLVVFFLNAFIKLGGMIDLSHRMFPLFWGEIQEFLSGFGPPAICAIFLAIKMMKDRLVSEEQKLKLISENSNAELEILKSQIHPHFLFNTLNNIYYFILNQSPGTSGWIDKLSAILDFMVTDCDAPHVPLNEELNMIRNYLELEGLRYGQRLRLQMDVNGSCGDKRITPLLLIPFIENSFKHGVSKTLTDPFISLHIEITSDCLTLIIMNSKPLNEVRGYVKQGIGLTSVKRRLEILYPKKHSLKVDQDDSTFKVMLTMPVFSATAGSNGVAYGRK